MKKLSILILIGALCFSMLLVHFALAVSEAPPVEWSKTYGTTRSSPSTLSAGNSVIQTKDGRFAVASTSDFGTGNEADQRIWLVKTDKTGNAKWNKMYGEQRVLAASIVETTDGGYAIAGDYPIGGYGNAWLAKIDKGQHTMEQELH